MKLENYVMISALKEIVGMQSQYLNRYLKNENLMEGLRIEVHPTSYHDSQIHEDDLEEVANRILRELSPEREVSRLEFKENPGQVLNTTEEGPVVVKKGDQERMILSAPKLTKGNDMKCPNCNHSLEEPAEDLKQKLLRAACDPSHEELGLIPSHVKIIDMVAGGPDVEVANGNKISPPYYVINLYYEGGGYDGPLIISKKEIEE